MAALDYTAMAGDLMRAGGDAAGSPNSSQPQNRWLTGMPGQPGGDPFAGIAPKPPMEAGPQTQPEPLPGSMPGPLAAGGVIDRMTPVGPSTAPGVPVLPQEGGSMSELFGSVLSSLSTRPSGGGIEGTGKPQPGAPVPSIQQPTNNFDAQLVRQMGGQQFGRT